MREFDNDGLILCELQAAIFEKSIENNSSSMVFAKRFMNSNIAIRMDNLGFLNESTSVSDSLNEVSEQYENKDYGSKKINSESLYWCGYIYRYWAYVFEVPSKEIYQIINVEELSNHYMAYHTLDPKQAIERIYEEKSIELPRDEIPFDYVLNVLKRIRKNG